MQGLDNRKDEPDLNDEWAIATSSLRKIEQFQFIQLSYTGGS